MEGLGLLPEALLLKSGLEKEESSKCRQAWLTLPVLSRPVLILVRACCQGGPHC